jgi:hypothetical protein
MNAAEVAGALADAAEWEDGVAHSAGRAAAAAWVPADRAADLEWVSAKWGRAAGAAKLAGLQRRRFLKKRKLKPKRLKRKRPPLPKRNGKIFKICTPPRLRRRESFEFNGGRRSAGLLLFDLQKKIPRARL